MAKRGKQNKRARRGVKLTVLLLAAIAVLFFVIGILLR
jgi:hypothetical protein